MKFHQLRPGARFRHQGRVYRKISPLKGACEDDTQKLIPRSAEVVPLDSDGEPLTRQLPDTVSGAHVEAMFGRFLSDCESAVARIEPPLNQSQRDQLLRELQAAARDLLAELAADG